MAKAKSQKTERQAKIDAIRSQQKNDEKRRGLMIVGVCVAIALLIVGAAAYQPIKNWWDLREFRGLDLAAIGVPASECADIETKVATGESRATSEPEQITYEDSPPAFGPHWNEPSVAPAAVRAQVLHRGRPPRAGVAGPQPRARLHHPLVRRDHRRGRRRRDRAARPGREVRRQRQLPHQVHRRAVDLRRRRRRSPTASTSPSATGRSAATATRAASRPASGSTAPRPAARRSSRSWRSTPTPTPPSPSVPAEP